MLPTSLHIDLSTQYYILSKTYGEILFTEMATNILAVSDLITIKFTDTCATHLSGAWKTTYFRMKPCLRLDHKSWWHQKLKQVCLVVTLFAWKWVEQAGWVHSRTAVLNLKYLQGALIMAVRSINTSSLLECKRHFPSDAALSRVDWQLYPLASVSHS